MLKRIHNSAKAVTIKTCPPVGFTKLDHLESTGSQHIKTAYVPDNETGVRLKGERYASGDLVPMGCRNSSDKNTCYYPVRPHTSDTTNSQGFGWISWKAVSPKITGILESRMNWRNSRTTNYFSDTKSGTTYQLEDLSFSPKRPIYLFCINYASSGSAADATYCDWIGTIHSASISQGNEIVHDFRAALDPTGTPCMFDQITRKPFYNSGTSDFLYSSPVSSSTYSLRSPSAEYAKMTNNGIHRLYHVPNGYKGSLEEYAKKNGYKILVESECPDETNKKYNVKWVETD